jgi:hypothetical protein
LILMKPSKTVGGFFFEALMAYADGET